MAQPSASRRRPASSAAAQRSSPAMPTGMIRRSLGQLVERGLQTGGRARRRDRGRELVER